jgi:hypothetical protein
MESLIKEARVGPATAADAGNDQMRSTRDLGEVVQYAHSRYYEPTARGAIFSLAMTANATALTAGHLLAAAAGAITQFALVNPPGSGKNYALLKFGLGVISSNTTASQEGVYHGFIPNAGLLTPASPGGSVIPNLVGNLGGSQAIPWVLSTGTALTGLTAKPLPLREANFTASLAPATVGMVNAIDEIAGEIILPPGTIWVPLWSSNGSSAVAVYSITWEEIPV